MFCLIFLPFLLPFMLLRLFFRLVFGLVMLPFVLVMVGLALAVGVLCALGMVFFAVLMPLAPFALVALVIWAFMQHSRAASAAPN
jgi:hypothetical protein